MTEYYDKIKDKLAITWLRLLKAEAKHKQNKVAKLEQKIIKLELKLRQEQ